MEFRVRREKVLTALQWLQCHNPFYSDIVINFPNLNKLPEDGIPEQLSVLLQESSNDLPVDEPSEETTNSSSFLPIPLQTTTEDVGIRSIINQSDPFTWPSIDNHPINEFKTSGLATLAFPTLFPYGTGDPTCSARQHTITFANGFKHLIRYAEVVDGRNQWRFASHLRFPYWALNMKMRHQLISQTSIYLHHHPADSNLTVEYLRDMVGRLDSHHLMSRLQRYAAKIQGSSQFWYQKYQELRALLDQKGSPTFFWTLSAADYHWPNLHRLMPHPPGTEITNSMRIQAVINNTHLTDWFFTSRVSQWVNHWLYNTLCAEWHWYRLEYQARGSTHAHGCVKLTNDPGICALVQKAAAAWEMRETLSGADPTSEVIHEGDAAKEKVLKYCDWLVTTLNDHLPDDLWSQPIPHPCAISVDAVTDLDADYYDLINCVQRHTRCSAAYCLRTKPGQQNTECRFKYPRPTLSLSTLSFERLTNGSIRATLATRRNDPRVNSHSRLLLQNWRANVDTGHTRCQCMC